jgi:hypothetical protein
VCRTPLKAQLSLNRMNQKQKPDLGHVRTNLRKSNLQRILKLILGTVVRLMPKKISKVPRKVPRKKAFLMSPKTNQSPHKAWRSL